MSKVKAEKAMAALGVTLDGPHRDPVYWTYSGFLNAPTGKLFDTHGTHCVSVQGDCQADFWTVILAELEGAGLNDCTTPGCDICAEEDEE